MQVLEFVRKKLGLNHHKMAQAMGVTQTQYSYMERKAQSLSIVTIAKLRKLAKEAGISAEELLSRLSGLKSIIICIAICAGTCEAQVPGGCYIAKPTEAQCSDAYIGDITLGTLNANVSFFGQTVGILVTEYQQTREILESVIEESGRKDDIILLLKKKLRRARKED